MTRPLNILRLDASARIEGSSSRRLADLFLASLPVAHDVIVRDLAVPLPLLDATWIGANFTPEADRMPAQAEALALSDALIAEIEAADVLLIGAPVYNFGVPAALKAWIDLVCRARRTFAYGPNGPVGLLKNKRAVVLYTSGGTAMGSPIDFASAYLRHLLGVIGITDGAFVDAGRQMADETSLPRAEEAVRALAATVEPVAAAA